ncbi:MAG: SDR family oxidoreductase [Thermomicrobiales bacterium]|nr:SDR family oxidoreductase [Thermomicrobiales bacterium]
MAPLHDTQDLAGKIAVITGGGSGVGRATALALATAGATTVLLGRSRPPLEETASLVRASGGTALVTPADVADESAVTNAFASAVQNLGGLDIVVLSAGIGRFGNIADYPLDDWNATLATNLTGPFVCAKAAIPHLKARGGGAIIAISSGAGKQGYAGLGAYSASKFGLMGLMQGLAGELAPDNIKVSTIVPGSIMTPFGDRPVEQKRAAAANDPGKKYLEPADVAEAVLYLLRQPARAWTQELNLWPF